MPNPMVARVDLDGSNFQKFENVTVLWPNGLAIDYDENRLYMCDALLDRILTMDFDGSNVKILASKGVPHTYAITVFGGELSFLPQKNNIYYLRIMEGEVL